MPRRVPRTVSVAFSNRTPCRAHGVRSPLVGIGTSRSSCELAEHVGERGWDRDPVGHREAQSVGLSGTVVGVLSEDHDPHRCQRREVQRCEHLILGRVHGVAPTFVGHEALEVAPVVSFELGAQDGVPVGAGRHRRDGSGREQLPVGRHRPAGITRAATPRGARARRAASGAACWPRLRRSPRPPRR